MKAKSTLATVVLVSTGAALLASATLRAEPSKGSHRGGTDITHYQVRKEMQNDGAESNATGIVSIEQNTQGHADHQQLQLLASGLNTNATFFVLALTLNETNQLGTGTNLTLTSTNALLTDTNLVVVDQVDANAAGRVVLSYRDFVQGNGHGGDHHSRFRALPAALQPVSAVRAIALADTNMQLVLSADLTTPDRLQCLLKRTLTNSDDTVQATLWAKASRHEADLRLLATGLAPQTDYCLVLDGGICQTNTTDSQGRLAAGFELTQPLDILNVSTVALWDTSSNVVVSAQLP